MPPELLAAVVGALMPPLVDQVVRGRFAAWPAWAKLAVALATSAVIGTLTVLTTGVPAGGWWSVVTAAFVASQVAYRTWWHRDTEKKPST